nr:reverse transcriptase, RNA-dependent DNA polymerase [Tanacetum cinerariifolium]
MANTRSVLDLVSFVVFGECRHRYAVSSLMDTAYWLLEQSRETKRETKKEDRSRSMWLAVSELRSTGGGDRRRWWLEESQRLLFKSSVGIESSTLLSKGIVKDKCSICGFKWHPPEKCWEKELTLLPTRKKAIVLIGFFKQNSRQMGTEGRNKARLVVQGNRQRHRVDYQETFAHVAKMVPVRSLLAIAAVKGWFTCQMDVSNAFLHGDLIEEVYMIPSLGYTDKGYNVSVVSTLDPICQGILLAHDLAVQLKAYCDSDWASCPMTRRSTTESEYRAMAQTCYEVTWLVSMLKDLGIKGLKPLDLFCDNQADLYIAANLIFYARTKHIEVDCHYVRDQLKASNIKPSYVHTKSQLAYVLPRL